MHECTATAPYLVSISTTKVLQWCFGGTKLLLLCFKCQQTGKQQTVTIFYYRKKRRVFARLHHRPWHLATTSTLDRCQIMAYEKHLHRFVPGRPKCYLQIVGKNQQTSSSPLRRDQTISQRLNPVSTIAAAVHYATRYHRTLPVGELQVSGCALVSAAVVVVESCCCAGVAMRVVQVLAPLL